MDTWTKDPVGIIVNEVADEVSWTPANNCAAWGAWHAKQELQWHSQTFWYVQSSYFNGSPTCSRVQAYSSAHFEDDTFCGFQTTTVTYQQEIDGYANGGWIWKVDFYFKGGQCTWLLSGWYGRAGNGYPF